jgi:diacylglycerol kinase
MPGDPHPSDDPRLAPPQARPDRRTWPAKFRDAFRGLWLAISSERSFAVHLPMAIAVIVAAFAVRVSLTEGCILALCITLVLAAELFNTALEQLAREVDRGRNAGIAAALDIASGAVLTTAMGSAIVGGAILTYRLGILAGWWEALPTRAA